MTTDTSGSRDTAARYTTAGDAPAKKAATRTDIVSPRTRTVSTTRQVASIVVRYTPSRPVGKSSTAGS